MRIRDIALPRVSYGYRRIQVMLKREGWPVNHKRVYRLYKLEVLGMRSKEAPQACHRLSEDGKGYCHSSQ